MKVTSKYNSILDYKGNPIREFPSEVPKVVLDKVKDKFPDYGESIPTYEDQKEINDPDTLWRLISEKIVGSENFNPGKDNNYCKEMMNIYHNRQEIDKFL